MRFLDPVAGLAAAAVVIPLLLLLYFLKLRRRPLRVGSTLLWQRAVRDMQVNAPFRWIRPSWLLLLQLLGLLALLAAVARPAIDAPGARADRYVLLIDRSASMAAPAGEGGGTRLDEAKRAAREAVEAASSGLERPEIMVATLAASPRVRAAFTSDRGVALGAIDGIEQTDQPGDLDAALRLIAAQTTAEGEDAPTTRVVLFSDGSFDRPARAQRASLGGASLRFVRAGPAPEAAKDNVGVAALSARRDYDDATLVRVFARLVSASPAAREASVALAVDGETALTESVEIPAATADAPGEAPLALELRESGGGVVTLSVVGSDDLESDDAASLVVAPPASVRTLVVAPEREGAPSADSFLVRALQAVDAGPVEVVTIGAYERRLASPGGLGGVDLLVFDRVDPSDVPPVPSLSFASDLPVDGFALTGDAQAEGSTRALSWKRAHPALRYAALDNLLVAGAPALRLPEETGEALATGDAGPLIGEVDDGPVRRIAVAFALSRSNWPLDVSFALFVASGVERLVERGPGAGALAWTTTEPVEVPAAAGARRVRAVGPIEVDAPVRDGAARLGVVPVAGLYALEGAALGFRTLAVNLADAHESAIRTAEAVEVSGEAARAGSAAETATREVWRWFVAVGAGLLILEWLLYAWRMRV